jgi:hypothetical protein
MNTTEGTQPLTFKRSLLFWIAHGIICAAPSFTWAIMTGYVTAIAISAMLIGTVILILLYTWLSLRTRVSIDTKYGFLASSIKWAAHVRAFFAILSLLAVLIPRVVLPKGPVRQFLEIVTSFDIIPGMLAVNLAGLLLPNTSTVFGREMGSFHPKFFSTLLTTLVTGILFSIIFFFLVAFVRMIIWFCVRARKAS